MKLPQPASRRAAWTLWVCALVLLLKAAMPMLASASAHAQRRALVEVCTAYGVTRVTTAASDAAEVFGASATSLATSGHGSDDNDDSDAAAHRMQHCALTALLAWTAPVAPALAWRITPRLAHRATPHDALVQTLTTDACAAWIAQLRHGPPTFA